MERNTTGRGVWGRTAAAHRRPETSLQPKLTSPVATAVSHDIINHTQVSSIQNLHLTLQNYSSSTAVQQYLATGNTDSPWPLAPGTWHLAPHTAPERVRYGISFYFEYESTTQQKSQLVVSYNSRTTAVASDINSPCTSSSPPLRCKQPPIPIAGPQTKSPAYHKSACIHCILLLCCIVLPLLSCLHRRHVLGGWRERPLLTRRTRDGPGPHPSRRGAHARKKSPIHHHGDGTLDSKSTAAVRHLLATDNRLNEGALRRVACRKKEFVVIRWRVAWGC